MADPSGQFYVPLGQEALRRTLALRVPPPAVRSFSIPGARRTEFFPGAQVIEWYPKGYQADGSIVSELRFALRYEPLDLRCLVAALARHRSSRNRGLGARRAHGRVQPACLVSL